MKPQFKVQQYQIEAVDGHGRGICRTAVCRRVKYRIDPGVQCLDTSAMLSGTEVPDDAGLRNAEIALTPPQLLANVHKVQQARGLELSKSLADPAKKLAAPINLDVEMETGTSKAYVYIKTVMELHKRCGWSEYIVVVPSIAIREA